MAENTSCGKIVGRLPAQPQRAAKKSRQARLSMAIAVSRKGTKIPPENQALTSTDRQFR